METSGIKLIDTTHHIILATYMGQPNPIKFIFRVS